MRHWSQYKDPSAAPQKKRLAEAAGRFEQTLKSQKMQLRDPHPDTLLTMSCLGIVYGLQGYLTNAEDKLRKAYKGQSEVLGPKHRDTLRTSRALEALKNKSGSRSDIAACQNELDLLDSNNTTPDLDLWKIDALDFGPETADSIELIQGALRKEDSMDPLDFGPETADSIELIQGALRKEDSSVFSSSLRVQAAKGDEEQVRALLNQGVPCNAQGGFYGTALQAASFHGHYRIASLLLQGTNDQNKADANIRAGIFGSAIRAAILGSHAEVLNLLLSHEHGEKIRVEFLNESLMTAVATNQKGVVTKLLSAGAVLTTNDKLLAGPLQRAAFSGHTGIMELLLQHNADPNQAGGVFGSPLRAAVAAGKMDAVALLLKSGATATDFDPSSEVSEKYQLAYEAILGRFYAANNKHRVVDAEQAVVEHGATVKLADRPQSGLQLHQLEWEGNPGQIKRNSTRLTAHSVSRKSRWATRAKDGMKKLPRSSTFIRGPN